MLRKKKPIMQSLLQVDWYKLTMGQYVFNRYPDIPVKYAFKNRTVKVELANLISEDDLREELDAFRGLRFKDDELRYLDNVRVAGKNLFSKKYLEFLKNLRLPEYFLEKSGGQYAIEFPGYWSKAIYWETPALAIINELANRAFVEKNGGQPQDLYKEGMARLQRKIDKLRQYPEIKFSDFGTRRQYSDDWHRIVTANLMNQLPGQFTGTSNALFAKEYGLQPIGTMAHELFMGMSGIMHGSDDEIYASHNKVLEGWYQEYGSALSIALTDTYGTDFFFKDMTAEQARAWRGLRHDSGDPIVFGEKAIAFYKRYGIDCKEKILVFSDGLEVGTILKIFNHFFGRIGVSFGWGTNLTNDLGINALSLVIKLIESRGHGTVKLSDNLAKATGKPEDVERFKKIFGHTINNREECIY